MAFSDKIKQLQFPGNHIENPMHQGQTNPENSFLSGIKQRLLSFIFQGLWSEERDETLVGLQFFFFFIAVQYSPAFYIAFILCLTCTVLILYWKVIPFPILY